MERTFCQHMRTSAKHLRLSSAIKQSEIIIRENVISAVAVCVLLT